MRDRETRLVNLAIAVEEDVEVDHPGSEALPELSGPPQVGLDPQQESQEVARGEGRLDQSDAIQEWRLVDDADFMLIVVMCLPSM